jgi:predicted amidohydrolase YtcJ
MTAHQVLLTDVDVEGRRADVRVTDGVVTEIAERLTASPDDDEVIAAGGGALLPGLHDHHVHLLAMAAAASSLDVSGTGPEGLERLRNAGPGTDGWVRATGYHDQGLGPVDRHDLDRLRADVPVRVQHRGGALWVLNSAALDAVPDLPGSSEDHGVERDSEGRRTGRLWRRDDLVRTATGGGLPHLGAVQRQLRALGITGVTDASPDLDKDACRHVSQSLGKGPHRLRVTLMTTTDPGPLGWAELGPYKVLLHDHDLPGLDDLTARLAAAHQAGRAVAVHCVTRQSLVLTLAAFEEAGVVDGDRIEHGSVIPPELVDWVARLGLRVVTQPSFLRLRGDDYLAEADPADRPHLLPYAALLAADVRVAPSSDVPYGSPDPWSTMRDARDRLSHSGSRVGADARVDPRAVLRGYLSPPDDPGGRPRRVRPGMRADLCLLHVGLEHALVECSSDNVARTFVNGE